MKKRVRVYRPGGQTNKPTHEDIVNYVSQEMSADDYDGDTDAIKDDLVNAGIPEDAADEYISNVSDDLGLNETEESIEEKERLAAEQEQAALDEEQALLAQQEAAEEERKARLAAMYDTNIDMSTTEDTAEDEEVLFAKFGGSKPNKRSFIKQYTKFAKMAQGGDTPTPGADDVLNGREAHVNNFLGAVKNTANDAILRQQAEAQYNAIYGTPQIGAYQDGGIHQEEIDPENPLHHLSTYGADTRHIFSDDMYTQNDVAALEQFGGNTGQGLYKFIGGGDNESADLDYQDADLDYNQYQKGGFRMPKRTGRQYVQAVNSPYYTATGERAEAPNLAGRLATSVNVTDRGLFGRPKAFTINYGNPNTAGSNATPQIKMPTEEQAKKLDAQYAAQERRGNRQPVADWMMRSGIPGVKQLGARMTKSGMIPEIPVGTQPTSSTAAPASDMPYYPPMSARAQRREARDDARLNRFLGNTEGVDVFNDPKEIAKLKQNNPSYVPLGESAPNTDLPIPKNSYLDPSVTASLNAGKNNPEVKAKAKLEDKKEEAKIINKEEEKINTLINPQLQADKVQAAIDNNTVGGLNRKALNYDYANDPGAKAFQNKYPSFSDGSDGRNEEFWTQQQPQGANQYSPEKAAKMRAMGLNPDIYGHHYLYQHPDKFKEYGGLVDYTEYAYGGDISVPELHKYQMDGQVAFNPNDNNMNISNLQGFFDKAPTKDVTGNPIDATVPESMQPDNINIDPNQANSPSVTDQPDNFSQDYLVKKDWNKIGQDVSAIGQGLGYGLKAGLDIADKIKARKQENQMLVDTTSAESNYGISNQDNRGDYDPNSGKFRPNETGFKSRYGGGIYAMGGNTMDEDEDVQYMTQEEIDDFIANGGELEYL